ASEVERRSRPRVDRVARREVDVGHWRGLVVRGQPKLRLIRELRLAPAPIEEILDYHADLPEAVAIAQVEGDQGVSFRGERFVLCSGTIGDVAQTETSPVSTGMQCIESQRPRPRGRQSHRASVAAVLGEGRLGQAQISIGPEPGKELPARLEVQY